MAPPRRRARVLVSGKVQGVFYRDETRELARRLGLGGWVRNLADGRVEAVFEGRPPSVEQALDWCARGPSRAEVTAVTTVDEEPLGETTFRIR